MQKKRRRGRTSTKTSVEDEIAHLRGLDLGLQLGHIFEVHRHAEGKQVGRSQG